MAENEKREKSGLFKGIMMAYAILVMHVLLVALVGCVVLFFRGITEYTAWVLIGCAGLIVFSGYYFYRRIRQEGKSLKETLRSPMFDGRPVEISLLGGIASVRIGSSPNHGPMLAAGATHESARQLEDPATVRIRELKELARLLENNLITLEEFNQTKQELFNHE